MSAIFGKINNHREPVQITDLFAMQTALNHWKADNKDIWNQDAMGLGHLLLHNTPESLYEKLPYYNEEAGLVITADTRIDNRDELCNRLAIPYALRDTLPDSSLVMKCYEQYGEHCVNYLTGDFAFAIWDKKKQQLFCARDHLGVRPFFYYHNNHCFAFATEKKGILALPGINQTINQQFFYNQLIHPIIQDIDTTLYQYIKKLPPAHTLCVNVATGSLQLTCYWTLDAETETRLTSREDYYEGLLYHFKEAVKCRTRSAFKIGVELSGGIDSSAITGVAQSFLRENGKSVVTLSNTLPDGITDENITQYDERKYMEAVIGFNHITDRLYITGRHLRSFFEEVDFMLQANDGLERWTPFWQLPSKNAASEYQIRTLLSGFPGDELVTYRGKHHFLDYRDQKKYVRYFLAKKKDPVLTTLTKLEPLLPYIARYGIHKARTRCNLHPAINAALAIYNIPKKYLWNRGEGVWRDMNYREQFKTYRHFQKYRLLKPHVSQRMESESIHGLYFRTEPRFPMADIRLAQFYLSMPNYLKYEGSLYRTTFRNAMKEYLPPLIRERNSKFGSVAPFLELYEYDWQQHIILLQQTDHPLVKHKAAIIEKMKGKAAGKEAFTPIGIPTPDVLKWLQMNPGSV